LLKVLVNTLRVKYFIYKLLTEPKIAAVVPAGF